LNERANAPNAEPEATDQAPLASRALLRELAIAGVCLLLGVLVMPCLIFAAGRTKLGPYEDGGVFALWRDFLVGLAHGSQAFWFVAVAPYLIVSAVRLMRRL
jgi:hypothetical protein